ncbi:MAG: hypothetical protein KC609_17190 [Myxococcales bacterium]|nr:hypothetical protein [Myxococcales bacterium]
MNRRSVILVILLAFIALVTLGGDLFAKKKRKKRRRKKSRVTHVVLSKLNISRYDAELARMPIGADRTRTYRYLKAMIEARYTKKMESVVDAMVRDSLIEERDNLLKRVAKDYVEFKGAKTGYEVTAINADFKHNSQEAMYYWLDGKVRKYYFTIRDKLYKAVWGFSDDHYAAMLARLTKLFGKPVMRDGALTWRGEKVIVRLRDERKIFGSYSVIVAHRVVYENLAALRGGGKSLGVVAPDVNSTVKELTSKTKEREEDVVDRLTKTKQKFDPNLGKKKEYPQKQ